MTAALAWLTIGVGMFLLVGGLIATRYFHRHRVLLVDNWVMDGIYRTVLTITIVAGWITFARIWYLWQGQTPVWMSIISGLMIIWLLLIPIMLYLLFRRREGQ